MWSAFCALCGGSYGPFLGDEDWAKGFPEEDKFDVERYQVQWQDQWRLIDQDYCVDFDDSGSDNSFSSQLHARASEIGTMADSKLGPGVKFGGKEGRFIAAYRSCFPVHDSCYRLLQSVMREDKSMELDEMYEWLVNHTTRGDSVPTHVDLAVMGGAEKLCGQYWEGTVEHQVIVAFCVQ
jgi:hypothetical protein